jgi:hypothetical protein
MKHEVKVVMLPTEDQVIPFNLHKCIKYYEDVVLPGENLMEDDIHNVGELDVLLSKYADNYYWEPQYLYITVSQDVEPIKEDDWYYDVVLNKVFQLKKICPHDTCDYMSNQDNKFRTDSNNARKIIATTDSKIYADYSTPGTTFVPQLQQSFLKEFVANPDGEFEVEYEYVDGLYSEHGTTRPLILKINQDNTVNITTIGKPHCKKVTCDNNECKTGCKELHYKSNTVNITSAMEAKTKFGYDDITHAIAYGHSMAKQGLSHHQTLINYKEANNIKHNPVEEKMYSLSDLERLGDYVYMDAKSTWDWNKWIKENL